MSRARHRLGWGRVSEGIWPAPGHIFLTPARPRLCRGVRIHEKWRLNAEMPIRPHVGGRARRSHHGRSFERVRIARN